MAKSKFVTSQYAKIRKQNVDLKGYNTTEGCGNDCTVNAIPLQVRNVDSLVGIRYNKNMK